MNYKTSSEKLEIFTARKSDASESNVDAALDEARGVGKLGLRRAKRLLEKVARIENSLNFAREGSERGKSLSDANT